MGIDRTLAVVASLVLAGCAAGRDECVGECEAGIQGGAPDTRDTAVVGVAVLDDGGFIHRTCTGTLIAPNLVLTAQHCIANTEPFVDCVSSMFGPPLPADRVRVTASTSMWSRSADWMPVAEILPPPGGREVCGHDVALVVLASCVDARRATPIPPLLDDPPERQEGYTAVGYGTTRSDADDAGLRRRRNALHVVCVGEACSSGQVQEDEWRGDHGICNGDSGGPAIDAHGFVIGVTSRGPTGCEDPIYGGLVAHAAWLREATRRAAHGTYTEPAWASSDRDEIHGATHESVVPAAGCAAMRPGGGGGFGGTLLGLSLVLTRGRRKR